MLKVPFVIGLIDCGRARQLAHRSRKREQQNGA